jgi:DNA-directed RNA polymerase subunit K/omega
MVTEKLSKFEKTRMLSARALQISDSAPVYLDKTKQTNSIKLAEEEYKAGKTPLKVVKN